MITAFYSYRGGPSRTLALANVGVALAQIKGRVLLVDLDLESPGLHWTPGLEPPAPITGGLLPWLADGCANAALWRDAIYTPRDDLPLDVLPACGGSLRDASLAIQRIDWGWMLQSTPDDPNLISPMLTALRRVLDAMGGYTHILIDAPTGLGNLAAVALFQLPHNAVLIGDDEASAVGRSFVAAAINKHGVPFRELFHESLCGELARSLAAQREASA